MNLLDYTTFTLFFFIMAGGCFILAIIILACISKQFREDIAEEWRDS